MVYMAPPSAVASFELNLDDFTQKYDELSANIAPPLNALFDVNVDEVTFICPYIL